MTINVPSVPCPSLRDSAMVESIRLADPMTRTWEAIAIVRMMPPRIRAHYRLNVDPRGLQ